MLDKSFGAPRMTEDGVTVAKEIELEDKFENMGAQMVREVASKSADAAGDGTTTATVLARGIFAEGARMVAAGHDPMSLKRGIEKAVAAITAVGPGGRDEAGKLIPIDLKVGDRVLFGKWSGTEVKLDGQELLIMKESDIMGVLTDLPAAKKKAA